MGIEQALLSQGYVPQGVAPKIEPERYSPLDNISEAINKALVTQQEKEKRTLDKKKNQADTYKTLRESGYSAEKAYESISKGGAISKPEDVDTPPPAGKAKTFTAEQGSKRRIGKQHILKKIQGWGKSGQVFDEDGDPVNLENENALNMFFIDQSDLSPYYDLDDKDIQTAMARAVKVRKGVDLKKEAKVEKKTLGQKIKEFLKIGEEQTKEVKDVKAEDTRGELILNKKAEAYTDTATLMTAIKGGKLKPGTPFTFQGKQGEWIEGRPAIRE